MNNDNAKKNSILVVDDMSFNNSTLENILYEYEIKSACSGKEALDIIVSGFIPDLILLDILMPDMDGYEVCQQLKKNPITQNIPIIFVTAKDDIRDEAKGLAVGAVDYITKPYQTVIVKARVKVHLELKKYRDHLYEMMRERTIQIDSAIKEVQSADKTKIQFLATVSNEIFTPIHGVIKMTDELLKTNLSKEQREYAETARISADFLLSLVTNIQDIAKIEYGDLNLNIVEFDLKRLISSTIIVLYIAARDKKISFFYDLHPDTPEKFNSDPARIKQILINIGGNAVKFTEQGEIRLNVFVEEDFICFYISDTGIGIPKDRLDNLFNYFSQVDSSTTRKYGGAGMGLAISKKLVEIMGGDIGVKSELGIGSTFWFKLPIIP